MRLCLQTKEEKVTDREKKLLKAAVLDECSDEDFSYLMDMLNKLRAAQRFGNKFCSMVEQISEEGDNVSFATIKKYIKELSADFVVHGVFKDAFSVRMRVTIEKFTDLKIGKLRYEIIHSIHEELEDLSKSLLGDCEIPVSVGDLALLDSRGGRFYKR